MNFWELAHPDYQAALKQRGVASQWVEQIPSRYELKLLTKAGEERWVDITAGVVQFDGRPTVVGTAFDITERHRAEQSLRQARDELERRVRERTAELAQANTALRAEIAERERRRRRCNNATASWRCSTAPIKRLPLRLTWTGCLPSSWKRRAIS